MKTVDIPLHELAAVAMTRAIAGAGVALVVTQKATPQERRAAGWTLLAIGALTTVPLALSILKRLR